MASCDDDFSLLGDDNDHHQIIHQPYAPQRFQTKSTPIHAPPLQSVLHPVAVTAESDTTNKLVAGAEEEEEGDTETESAFHENSNFNDDANVRSENRRGQEDQNEGGDCQGHQYNYKRARTAGGGEYRKDREEWSDVAITCLLDAYLEKFAELNRGNLRGKDWEEVAMTVTQRCEKQSKTVEQCKNKVDNLKKRYKLERHRMSSGGVSISHWPWFKKMEEIVGNSAAVKIGSDENKGSGSCSGSIVRQPKRSATIVPSPLGQTNNLKPKSVSNSRWRRVILKISGVALAGMGPNNIDPKVMMLIVREVAIACHLGVQVAIVVGGRNIFCADTWVTATGSHRRTAYQIGMMASVMNCILLQSALEKTGVEARVQTAFPVEEVAEPYSRQRAIKHLEKGRVVIFGGLGAGVGNPLFSTDTAAAMQASEIHAEAVLKGTNIDGVYDCNSQDSNVTFEHISFRDLVARGATSMDIMALTFCEENGIPVVVFNLLQPGNISKALCGEHIGTLIDQTGRIS